MLLLRVENRTNQRDRDTRRQGFRRDSTAELPLARFCVAPSNHSHYQKNLTPSIIYNLIAYRLRACLVLRSVLVVSDNHPVKSSCFWSLRPIFPLRFCLHREEGLQCACRHRCVLDAWDEQFARNRGFWWVCGCMYSPQTRQNLVKIRY